MANANQPYNFRQEPGIRNTQNLLMFLKNKNTLCPQRVLNTKHWLNQLSKRPLDDIQRNIMKNCNKVRKNYVKQKEDPEIVEYLYKALFDFETRDRIHKMVMSNPDLMKHVLKITYTENEELPDAAIDVLINNNVAMKAILNEHYLNRYDLMYIMDSKKKTVLNTYAQNNINKLNKMVKKANKMSKIDPYAGFVSSYNQPRYENNWY